jgi:Family of unknown function (DUF6807)
MILHHSVVVKLSLIFLCHLMIDVEVSGQHFTTIKSSEGIEISENGNKVLFYQVRPKSVDGKYERSGFVHPLYDLNGKILTDDMPRDHPYHRGIFWAWHQIILNDKNIADGWMSDHVSFQPVKTRVKKGRGSVILHSEMIWNAELETNKWQPIVKEKTTIRVFKSTLRYRMLDFDINLFALTDGLQIGGSDDEKGYGGFCLRLKLPADISFASVNKNVIPQETPVLAGPWMDITGSFDGPSSPKNGVIVFGYRSGLRNQYPWILRRVTSMQNVPFPGRSPILLSKKGLKLSYRIIVHNGEMSNEEIGKLYQQYTNKPSSQ